MSSPPQTAVATGCAPALFTTVRDADQARPLSGLRVLEVSQLIAGPLAGVLLADLGAEVVKIEAPAGDEIRRVGAEWTTTSAIYAALNRDKSVNSVDLGPPAGKTFLHDQVREADVVVHNLLPDRQRKLGLTAEQIHELNPRAVIASICGYPTSGPRATKPAVDLAAQVASGILNVNGGPDEPMGIGLQVVDITTGYLAVIGIQAALLERERTGCGRHIELNLHDSALFAQIFPMTEYLHAGHEPRRLGRLAQFGSPAGVFATADGYVQVSAYFPGRWPAFCRIIEREDLIDDPRFGTHPDRLQRRLELADLISERLVTRTSAEWVEALEKESIACAALATYPDVVAAARRDDSGVLVTVEDAATGARTETVGLPMTFNEPARPGPSPGSV